VNIIINVLYVKNDSISHLLQIELGI